MLLWPFQYYFHHIEPVERDKERLWAIEPSVDYFHDTVELQWLEHLWDHENKFETRVVRANEC